MKLNPMNILFGERRDKRPPKLLAVTPPRTGERTMLGVENMLQSIAVPEPFSLEMAGDVDGVTLMARCLDDQVVRGQISAHYPQARIHEVPPEDDPLRLDEGEEAWGTTCGRAVPTTCRCAPSGTMTSSTPAPTPSSPCSARCPT